MKHHDYNAVITVNKKAEDVFKKATAIATWWTENTEGSSQNLNDIFTVRFGETYVTFKTIELVPNQKIVWLVTDCLLPWLTDKREWNNTKLILELSAKNGATNISFTHLGLVPEIECYDGCRKGWDQYFKGSLYQLLTEGKGQPALATSKV